MTDTIQNPTPATPEAATQERTFLLNDPAWREKAMNPNGREWHQLQALDRVINGMADEGAPSTTDTQAKPDEYDFSSVASFAKANGVEIDPSQEADLRSALHTAGVDGGLAAAAYMVTVDAAAKPRDEVQAQRELAQAEQTLRARWGASYGDRMTLANAEARRLFEALPASVKGGRDYETFMDETGLGRAPTVFEQLALRAEARKR